MKKVLALVLAVVLAFGMASVAFAASNSITEITGVALSSVGLSGNVKVSGDGMKKATSIDFSNVNLGAKATIKIYPKPDWFAWKSSLAADAVTKLTSGQVSNVSLKISGSSLKSYFNDPVWKSDSTGPFIELTTKNPIVLTADKDVEGKLTMSYKGSSSVLDITGQVKNEQIDLAEGNDSVWPARYEFTRLNEFVKDFEFGFDDASIFANVFSTKKYYAFIENNMDAKDEEIVAKYPTIEAVYKADVSSNLQVASTFVTFDLDEKYYVYDQDMKYLNMSNEKLPLVSKYFLSTTKIEAAAATTPAEAPADGTAPVDDTKNPAGGGDEAPVNANNNPGTGADSFVNVAVVAGMVALAAAGFASKK